MSKIKKTIGLDKIGIESLSMPEKDKQYFRQLVGQLEQMHREMKEQAEAGGASTRNWEIREATAADVTAGSAAAVENLIVRHKTNGTKFEHEA